MQRNSPVTMKTLEIILTVIAIAIIASKAYNSPNRITDTDTVLHAYVLTGHICAH